MTAITLSTPRIRVPDLGPRSEGWVALQAFLFVAVVATGLSRPVWAGTAGASAPSEASLSSRAAWRS